ncbi:hypothetical protein [Kineosporia babensis]|uniref:Uncharacterized protein n=1 Tax=Kineosporia babensis TaxID=499548 RepID=A0A9X1NAS7_9ACTN|nr:hypothetical protein [Kineosporia babensis]MCD5310703.1 hypothetical protein [Kineosporia babensis]
MNDVTPDQPAPKHLLQARSALEAVLLNDDLDIYSFAVISDALAQLVELHPLQAPSSDEPAPLALLPGVERAAEALAAAAEDAESPREQIRIALLRRHLGDLLNSSKQ